MGVPYYDDYVDPTRDDWIDLERIYCFDWDAFSHRDMDHVRAIFALLPRWRCHDANDCHWWYSEREDAENGYLTAGVEPPGLQVFGTLPILEWEAWDRAFQDRATGLPFRTMS